VQRGTRARSGTDAFRVMKVVLVKVLVVGNARSGKSSVVRRLAHGSFAESAEITVGADYARKDMVVLGDVRVRLQLWDLAGQDRYAALVRPYYRGAAAVLIVCDVTKQESIQAIQEWKMEIQDKLDHDIPIVVLANKNDLNGEEQKFDAKVAADLQVLCYENRVCGWFIGSAKTGENVDKCFDFLAKAAYKHIMAQQEKQENSNEKENDAAIVQLSESLVKQKETDSNKSENFTGSTLQSCCFSM
jgi:Ras-related protein Rab-32